MATITSGEVHKLSIKFSTGGVPSDAPKNATYQWSVGSRADGSNPGAIDNPTSDAINFTAADPGNTSVSAVVTLEDGKQLMASFSFSVVAPVVPDPDSIEIVDNSATPSA